MGRRARARRSSSPSCSARRPGAAAQLSLVCALSVAEIVEAGTALEARLKWPNDVLVEGRKVAGILLEGRDDAVVCGIGINVNQLADALPAQARTPAGLAPHAHRRANTTAALVLVALLARLETHYDAWLASGLAPAATRARGTRRTARA